MKIKGFKEEDIRAVIFDFDGVIVDSEPFWEIADRKIVQDEGKVFNPEVKPLIMGLSPLLSIMELIRFHHINTDPEKLILRREKIMKNFYDNVIELNPGVIETFEYLHLRGIKIALASSTPRRLFEGLLSKYRLKRFISTIVTSEDVRMSKPNPEIFLKVRDALNLKREQILVVEDSRAGVEAALSARMTVFWLKNREADIRGLHPDYIINSLTDLILFFERHLF